MPKPTNTAAPPRLLTEVELELMTILWRLGEGTVTDVLAALPPERPLAYTSVSTILRILEKKDVLATRKQGRGHVYVPRFTKEVYEAFTLEDLITRVFDGAPSALVRRLVDTKKLSDQELADLRALLRTRGQR
jgi:predicted transcriptional regulator